MGDFPSGLASGNQSFRCGNARNLFGIWYAWDARIAWNVLGIMMIGMLGFAWNLKGNACNLVGIWCSWNAWNAWNVLGIMNAWNA